MSLSSIALREYAPYVPVTVFCRRAKRALVVDDSAVNRKIANLHLQSLGLDVDLAVNASEAIKKCYLRKFDLIIMDVMLPGITGLECVQYMRRHIDDVRRTLILGWSTAATLQQCRQAGMDGILPKPLDVDCLRNWLADLNTGRSVN